MKDGFYNLYSKHEDEPVLVHCYYSNDSKCRVVGFNTHDGGGILPISDFTKDTVAVSVVINETNQKET